MKCNRCGAKMVEKKDKTLDGFDYRYYSCTKCNEEILDMEQLHEVAQKYREMRKYQAKLSKWGESMAIRIPKPLVKEFNLKENGMVSLIPEKKAIKIITG